MKQEKIGVILAQIGTPSEPTAKAVRPYLKRFLSDRRIVDYHPLLWQPLLQGVILTVRPKRSAKLYKEIWTEQGSPLRVYLHKQQVGLQERLGEGFRVEVGMAYSEPSIEQAMRVLENEGITRIIIMPLFPQYSSTTTASVYDEACFAALGRRSASGSTAKRFVPTLRFVDAYYNHPGYIAAMKHHLEQQLKSLQSPPDKFILTFHGIPQRYADTGDPYPDQCLETAELLAREMGWARDQWGIVYQSRFGREPWVGPATFDVLGDLARQGVKRPFLFAPGFATDCLETLHEIGVEGREVFENAGGPGELYTMAPCLNDQATWLDFLTEYVRSNAQGWV
ncbi:ferrochelatase [Paenibacillus segetis]|uniref:Coproporphyrin III ferrochelatase n=1 Tax=Paenibacillus segetis TaxID=1325360 RepID=A0ABQ1YKG5_9BACL|nr:ferrochelatase [Paenibacillus segetis]GGH29150.1 ferrochelatase 1 [Paenibacillus segetis]